jgi:hypothetical protein
VNIRIVRIDPQRHHDAGADDTDSDRLRHISNAPKPPHPPRRRRIVEFIVCIEQEEFLFYFAGFPLETRPIGVPPLLLAFQSIDMT